MRFRTTTLLLVLLLTTARTTPGPARIEGYEPGCGLSGRLSESRRRESRGRTARRGASDPLRGVRGPEPPLHLPPVHVQRAVHLLRSRRRGAEHGNRAQPGHERQPRAPGNRRLRMGRSESLLAGGRAPSARPGTSEYRSRPTAGASGATRRCGPVK